MGRYENGVKHGTGTNFTGSTQGIWMKSIENYVYGKRVNNLVAKTPTTVKEINHQINSLQNARQTVAAH